MEEQLISRLLEEGMVKSDAGRGAQRLRHSLEAVRQAQAAIEKLRRSLNRQQVAIFWRFLPCTLMLGPSAKAGVVRPLRRPDAALAGSAIQAWWTQRRLHHVKHRHHRHTVQLKGFMWNVLMFGQPWRAWIMLPAQDLHLFATALWSHTSLP